MQAAAFVLAGGRSSRMGSDKALLTCGSRPLIEVVATTLSLAVGTVALVGEPERYRDFGFDCLPDLRTGCGPLAGIEAALAAGRGEYNVIVACDIPNVCPASIRALLQASNETGALCAAARDATGKIHPLCAVYRSGCLPAVRGLLDAGQFRLSSLLRDLNAITIDIGEKLWNLNTVADWHAWLQEGEAAAAAGKR